MEDLIMIIILVIIIGTSLTYIIKSKKKGVKCIGCPSSSCCSNANKKDGECCNCKKESD